MRPSLTLTAALAPLAKEHGVDLTALALAEIEFDRKVAEMKAWLRSSRVAEINRQHRAIASGTVAGRQSPSLASRLGPDGRPSTIAKGDRQ